MNSAELSWFEQNWAELNWMEPNLARLGWSLPAIAVGDFSTLCLFSSSFDLSDLALDRTVWNQIETDKNTSSPIGNWTNQKGIGEITHKNSEFNWFQLISTSYCCWWFLNFMSLFVQFWPVQSLDRIVWNKMEAQLYVPFHPVLTCPI